MEDGIERPRAVCEYLVERMIRAGVSHLCFVVSPGKTDILEYFGGNIGAVHVCYTVQSRPFGFCDAVFRALPFIPAGETLCVGLPDTIWFPVDGLGSLPEAELSFLLFPVAQPELFDSVVLDDRGGVRRIDVKQPNAISHWIWGAFKMPQNVFYNLHALWSEAGRHDEYFGTLVNAYLDRGGRATGVRAGEAYVDTGTLHGYREAMQMLSSDHCGSAVPRLK
jgi:glucose-1-phosphate thymidylyltransferase